ncbi:MAG: hypothetical protein ACI9MS_002133 [Glaciecola sp.]|jgi:uncharacterized protein YaaN involved in tellurite resistance
MSTPLTIQTVSNSDISQTSVTHPDVAIKLEQKSGQLIEQFFSLDMKDVRNLQQHSLAIRELGLGVQKQLAKRSHLLKQPLAKLVAESDSGSVSHSLIALQEQTYKINPNKIDFNMSGLRRWLAKIPAIGSPISRWFAKYQSVDSIIQSIVNDLKDGQSQLERDNITLGHDQVEMKALVFQLKDYLTFCTLLDEKITTRLSNDPELSPEQRTFIEEELLFSLKQRTLDLQQQLAVNQQGILTSDVIIRNNRELIRGVSRALNVTISALNIAASLAIALQSQKNISTSITAINSTTDDLIAQTSQALKQQAGQIHKQAASAQLDINNLKESFENILVTIDDISRFRREAIPAMTQSISEMSALTAKMDSSLASLGASETPHNEILLDLA